MQRIGKKMMMCAGQLVNVEDEGEAHQQTEGENKTQIKNKKMEAKRSESQLILLILCRM